jgi:hypothetical protein
VCGGARCARACAWLQRRAVAAAGRGWGWQATRAGPPEACAAPCCTHHDLLGQVPDLGVLGLEQGAQRLEQRLNWDGPGAKRAAGEGAGGAGGWAGWRAGRRGQRAGGTLRCGAPGRQPLAPFAAASAECGWLRQVPVAGRRRHCCCCCCCPCCPCCCCSPQCLVHQLHSGHHGLGHLVREALDQVLLRQRRQGVRGGARGRRRVLGRARGGPGSLPELGRARRAGCGGWAHHDHRALLQLHKV